VEYESRCADSGETPTPHGFLEEISLITDLDKYDESADAVVLMTVHAAKGLEFPVVFLAGMEDGIFPSQQNIGERDEMSEERRLAYVAITRAKEKLYITHTKYRLMYGKTSYNRLSGFIRDEVPPSLIDSDLPKAPPPRRAPTYTPTSQYQQNKSAFSELNRAPSINAPKKRTTGAAEYGIEKFAPGTRVVHTIFGEGTVLSARDMGGDVLYEVQFDGGMTKKLMATFAKLKRI
jgi:DNA helicase-2/ATP-dependent DNA helicase PcrA